MNIAGMIVEYNPMHLGHLHMLNQVRTLLDGKTAQEARSAQNPGSPAQEPTAVIAVMSGNYVQRGDFALLRSQARARAALESGADLVLELPLPWAAAPAERFADGGIQALLGTGLVTHLAFGSECGDAGALWDLARALLSEDFPPLLRQELAAGDSFAAARQRALARLTSPEEAALLERPNNILGTEYCKALLRRGGDLELLTVPRLGADHDAAFEAPGDPGDPGAFASSSAIRALLREGRRREALEQMTPAMAAVYEAEEQAGRAPVLWENCQRALLARLRTMAPEDFAALDQGGEGLWRRLWQASRTACSLEEVLEEAKTKRYPYARLRRMCLWAYLGLTPEQWPERVPYLRLLGANALGRELLARMRKTANLPILTKPAHARRLTGDARALWDLEARAADLYALGCPDLAALPGGWIWREGPVLI